MSDIVNKSQTEHKPRVGKVVQGAVKTKKKSGARKLADVFIEEDIREVKSYAVEGVLVPLIKKAFCEAIKATADAIFMGGAASRGRSSESKVSYRSYYDGGERRSYETSKTRSRFDYDDIVFETRGDAEAVLDAMLDCIDRYKFVTVADLYDLADRSAPYTSSKYGWLNLRSAEVIRVRDGYIIKLPKASPID